MLSSKLYHYYKLFILLFLTCHSYGQINFEATNYISLPVPIDYKGKVKYIDSSKVASVQNILELKHDTSLLNSFNNLVSNVTIYKEDETGGLTLYGSSLSGKKETYVVIYDFMQSQSIFLNKADKSKYYALVGVSTRLVVNVTTKKKSINLANLFGLGISAEKNKLAGKLEVKINGISSEKINSVIPVTSDLSTTSIANALQAIATIKVLVYDSKTVISPQILAFFAHGDGKIDINNTETEVTSFNLN